MDKMQQPPKSGWLRWAPGRQGTGYAKMLLATGRWPVGFDLYFLRYCQGHGQGQGIPTHTDPVPGKAHWRLNIELWKGAAGGLFECDAPGPRIRLARVILFRPDLCAHRVSPVEIFLRKKSTF